MRPNLLVLGGTTQASALAKTLAEQGIAATFSYAGRVDKPKPQPLPTRIGGFGGVEGLVDWITTQGITHVIDATHPFAAQMSTNAVHACARTKTPLLALSRPPWQRQAGDIWTRVGDIDGAVAALAGPRRRVMLAIGRMHLDAFAANQQHFYLLRLIDRPQTPLPFAEYDVVIEQGPFTQDADQALMQAQGIDLVVSKNSGGTASRAKNDAARALSIPVLMIDRPVIPKRAEVSTVPEVLEWLRHTGADLGV